MLPQQFQLPAAIALVLAGALACFAGYRLFRVVLAIYGFVLGAMIASSALSMTNTVGMLIAAAGGGLVGAIILVFAYFVGIALVGAGLGALVAHAITVTWGEPSKAPGALTDPPTLLLILLAVVGAIAAMLLQRYVIVVATAFGGAWTMIIGGMAAGGAQAERASATDVWVVYPFSQAPTAPWVMIVWVALGALGTAVQLAVTARKKR